MHFNQPVLQTAQMFVGEMGCWLVIGLVEAYRRYTGSQSSSPDGYHEIRTEDPESDPSRDVQPRQPKQLRDGRSVIRGFRVLLLGLPSSCDILATTLMNAGLLMVAASIYQMTRGALVLFVGLFSVVFLRRRLHLFQWLSLVGVVLGVAVVGLAGAIYPDQKQGDAQSLTASQPIQTHAEDQSASIKAVIGVTLIASAQIFTATQFVLEEWILENSPIEPIWVVGWEGLFGFVVTVVGMAILHLVVGRTETGRLGYFDMAEGWRQLTTYPAIYISSILIMISIGYVTGVFGVFGLSLSANVMIAALTTLVFQLPAASAQPRGQR